MSLLQFRLFIMLLLLIPTISAPLTKYEQAKSSIISIPKEQLHKIDSLITYVGAENFYLRKLLSTYKTDTLIITIRKNKILFSNINADKSIALINIGSKLRVVDYYKNNNIFLKVIANGIPGWIIINNDEITDDIALFLNSKEKNTAKENSTLSSLIVQLVLSSLVGSLSALSIDYLTKRRREKKKNIWEGVCALPAKMNEKLSPNFIGRDSPFHFDSEDLDHFLQAKGIKAEIMDFFKTKYEDRELAQKTYQNIVDKLQDINNN